MKTLVEIHVLQNFAPSNLNRDDTGAPKDAWFGGTRRARVSSQCQKRAVREYFGSQVGAGVFSPDELATRTKRILQAVADALAGKRDAVEAMARTQLALSYVKLKSDESGKTQYLLFMGRREITSLAQVIDEHWNEIVPGPSAQDADSSDGAKKKTKSKKGDANAAPKEVQSRIEAVFNGGKAVDLALFGRMLADMPEKNQHAACQVAHAISTHAVEREFDFFTAVDDLKPEDTAGADMMGTVEFNSACFYRYAAVDWAKLEENLQGDTELAAKGLRAFLEGFVVAEPTGKQNTFAAHNPPEFVLVTVRRRGAPRNLANAFETAVRVREYLTKESALRLIEKAEDLQRAYGGSSQACVLSLVSLSDDDKKKVSAYAQIQESLQAVLDSAMNQLRGS
jgi:CRISPR system Cascade subunit CasC